jgi:oxygen-independent coproporphyrinogen-3 oxidase
MHFYIHIPFCRQKCPYCKFALTPVYTDAKKRRYIAFLKNEICTYFQKNIHIPQIRSIYLGGGTPSILSRAEIQDILGCFPDVLTTKNIEISIECNPEDISTQYIQDLLDVGITRISIGIQTLSDTSLAAIHRSSRADIERALVCISTVLGARTDISVNVDMILGLPYVRAGETLQDIAYLHRTYPYIAHTSIYILEDEKYPTYWAGETLSVEDIQSEYMDICTYFQSAQYVHYEVSNWAKK